MQENGRIHVSAAFDFSRTFVSLELLPNDAGTAGVAHEENQNVRRLTFSSVAIRRVRQGALGTEAAREDVQETWLLAWALSPPARVTLGKILNFSLLQLSHLQIEDDEAH